MQSPPHAVTSRVSLGLEGPETRRAVVAPRAAERPGSRVQWAGSQQGVQGLRPRVAVPATPRCLSRTMTFLPEAPKEQRATEAPKAPRCVGGCGQVPHPEAAEAGVWGQEPGSQALGKGSGGEASAGRMTGNRQFRGGGLSRQGWAKKGRVGLQARRDGYGTARGGAWVRLGTLPLEVAPLDPQGHSAPGGEHPQTTRKGHIRQLLPSGRR